LIPSVVRNQLAWASFPCTKWPFPINSHAGEGFQGLDSLRNRRKNVGRGRKEEKNKVEALPCAIVG